MLHIYNSLTNKIEPFTTKHEKKVNMYVCGPTVYDYIHIGNARPVIFFDLVKRYLTFLGYDVIYASNITDIDDRIVKKAQMLHTNEQEVAQKYAKIFLSTVEKLGSKQPDLIPYATDFIEQMITYIQSLIDNKYAYITKSGVYFRVNEIKDYGILSNQQIDALKSGVRIDLAEDKESGIDFALWKFPKEGVLYQAPWGAGRPGWHTECAVMNHELFGEEIDIHGGGSDLKFPHHENEIAQTVAHSHHHLARFWMHVGRLDFNEEKMSKSLGNVVFVKDLLEKYDASVYRLLIFAHHYRAPIAFTHERLEQYQKTYDKISYTAKKIAFRIAVEQLYNQQLDDALLNVFKEFMNDDFNTPNVVSLIETTIKSLNKTLDLPIFNSLRRILDILGIDLNVDKITKEDIKTYHEWQKARENKDWQKADILRKQLLEQGWI